jgi:ribosomal protein S21
MEIIVKQFNNSDLQTQEIERCLKKLKKELERDGTFQELKDRQFHKKPSEIRREKDKLTRSLIERKKRKQEAWEERYGDIKFIKRKEENGNPRPTYHRPNI